MVRFPCFLTPINYHRSKKVVERSAGAMRSIAQDKSCDQTVDDSFCSDNIPSNTSTEQVTNTSSHEGCWKSEDLNGNSCPDDSEEFIHMLGLKKSQSLGSVLDKRRGFSGDDVSEDDAMDQGLSSDYSQENDVKGVGDSFDNTGSVEVDDHRDPAANTRNRHQENHDYLISVRVLKKFDGDQHADVGEHSSDHVVDSLHSSSNTLPILPKSRSATNLRVDTGNSIEDALAHESTHLRSRSFKDLSSLNGGRHGSLKGDNALYSKVTFERHIASPYSHDTPEASDIDGEDSPSRANSVEECHLSNPSDEFNELAHQERGSKYSSRKFVCVNQSVDGHMPHNYDGLVNEWREPEINGVKVKKNLRLDSIQYWNELTSIEFNIKRIEQWISQIDIQNAVVEEPGESSRSVSKKDPQVVAGMTTTKPDANSLGIEVAYNYISSLNAKSSSALMSNLGLVVVPFLGAFINLRLLNLSGNAIVRITAGVLPRGLHILNLSKNNISTIEGLRDLTRLRVLDLSYNRIVRIGHGLASCSSLKELYLGGNKISEVEGLHRLLKLNVIDLRLNRISTAKGLGQLAANYGSLHAINLEGNPAQRNVGDEQLKKYLLSLLPHLVYYNKLTIRSSCSKEVTDRPPRSVASHRFDWGTRTEQSHTRSRRGARSSNPIRPSPSKHGRPNPVTSPLLKRSKNQHVRLFPAGIKASNHLLDIGAKQPSLKPR